MNKLTSHYIGIKYHADNEGRILRGKNCWFVSLNLQNWSWENHYLNHVSFNGRSNCSDMSSSIQNAYNISSSSNCKYPKMTLSSIEFLLTVVGNMTPNFLPRKIEEASSCHFYHDNFQFYKFICQKIILEIFSGIWQSRLCFIFLETFLNNITFYGEQKFPPFQSHFGNENKAF